MGSRKDMVEGTGLVPALTLFGVLFLLLWSHLLLLGWVNVKGAREGCYLPTNTCHPRIPDPTSSSRSLWLRVLVVLCPGHLECAFLTFWDELVLTIAHVQKQPKERPDPRSHLLKLPFTDEETKNKKGELTIPQHFDEYCSGVLYYNSQVCGQDINSAQCRDLLAELCLWTGLGVILFCDLSSSIS